MMKQLIVFFSIICAVTGAKAQGNSVYTLDSVFMLPEARIHDRFANDTDRYRYNQMKYYVTTVMPYVNAATKVFVDVDKKINEPGTSRKERKAYVALRENDMRTEFEERLRKLNVTQGALLVKLISRQTELNIYSILKEFKNPLTAVKWQAWARMNGLNLDRMYHPEEEQTLERIMEDLGYPLPVGYKQRIYVN